MRRLQTTLLGMAMAGAALPAGSAWAASPTPQRSHITDGKFAGPSVHMQWGNVQVTIITSQGKIINVKAKAPNHTSRSKLINSVALPVLKHEVLKAQSAQIQSLSGATLTSNAYIASLATACKAAGV